MILPTSEVAKSLEDASEGTHNKGDGFKLKRPDHWKMHLVLEKLCLCTPTRTLLPPPLVVKYSDNYLKPKKLLCSFLKNRKP